jgi:hypothetical protein
MESVKWVVVASAPDQLSAEIWRDIVRQTGIDCELRPGDTASFLGVSQVPVRLMAPEPERDRVRGTLAAVLGGPVDVNGP